MKKIRDRRYEILIILNIVFGLVILFLLYTNTTLKERYVRTNFQTQTVAKDGISSDPTDTSQNNLEKPVVINGDFEQGGLGWNNQNAIQCENNGNHYIANGYNWDITQDIQLIPNVNYKLFAYIKKGTATGPARIAFTFHDVNGIRLNTYYNIEYVPKGNGWEEIPPQIIQIPKNTTLSRIYLLTEDGKKGFHCFDNIRLTRMR
ncbi:hypothetical protein [Pelotomaculum propionicicum]|uniref:CBM-cenC domain-containing protein n=1 Tax=Pelotomaculum propionicicum TaxID=258475 RepID=A0A4Y7RKM1_9FIRM|nr:hypothetical protein [Pelotomaculum propionicicum]TEB09525.1 hypothetical protein Pmgp_03070 [Pelotomaculum propionicicum]